MRDLVHAEAQEVAVSPLPPKNVVEEGDVFMDHAHESNYFVVATTISDSSGWRYLCRLWDDGSLDPDGMLPDSDLLNPRLFKFCYRIQPWPR